MTELSPRARDLLAQARAASTPTAADAATVLAGLGSLAPAAGAGAAASGAVAKGAGLSMLKLSLTFALAVGAGVATTGVVIHELRPATSSRVDVVGADPPVASRDRPPEPQREGDRTEFATPVVATAVVAAPEGATQEDATQGGTTPEMRGGAAPETRGDATLETRGGATPETRGGAAPKMRGSATPETQGGGTPEPRGGATPELRASSRNSTPHPDPLPRGGEGDARCALSAELVIVRRAQTLLTTAPREAVSVLEAWERDCRTGALFEERLALRALALCSQPELESGRATLLELRTRFPTSPALQRVERACTPP